jgi:CPA1 family monovalent cation:H+ antiporter
MSLLELTTLLALLAAIIALTAIGPKIKLPAPTLMVIAGLAIGLMPGLPSIRLDPDLVFLVFLPPILYAAAWNTWWHDFQRNLTSISLLAFGLVVATMLAVAVVAHAVVPGMPWGVAFLLGAIVSPPDAAAATAICQRLGVSRNIVTVLEGESLVNDAAGLICFRVALTAIVSGTFDPGRAAINLVWVSIAGVAVGLAIGVVVAALHKRIRDPLITTGISMLAPYLAYLPAEKLHVSGVLATVTAGLYVSWKSPAIFSPQARLAAIPFWNLIILIVNGLLFVLIGLNLDTALRAVREYSLTQLAWYALAVSAAAIVIRVIWVFSMARASPLLARLNPWGRRERPLNLASQAVVAWTGMRGMVSLALALSLPITIQSGEPFPMRDLIVLLTFAVIFATLVIQSLTLPPLIRFLGEDVAAEGENEEIVARLIAASTALSRLEGEGSAASTPASARVRDAYLERVELATNEILQETVSRHHGRAGSEDTHRLRAIHAEREAILRLREQGELSEETFRKIERDLDLEESRLT